ncbi:MULTISPECIES: ABC transporter substrate-binding protein [unclassified Xanthobacter]|uniref:ABC transporter substrate-binding protein n=1 Tax=unclassified Xanthobacter TaxID=2623496 RepID=UPI00145E1013|nr:MULTISPECIES: ABC transporter substrate-binding protein [unclassified Xanthobacter]NMN58224.1 branched-chain amino acid transport system substrate-binding protein [Xanthobacter sp. SG618]UJX44500.1 ABC transporter substrate-binding protein [Xanthobacter sp. YC-JY1]
MTRSLPLTRRHVVAGLASLPAAALLGRPAAAQAAEIPVGMVLPFSGATGPYGPDMKKAAEMVVRWVNDAGGILGGRPLKLFIEDSETNPTVGVTATKKLLEVNKVELVGGFWGSPIALAAKPIILAADKVQMVSCSANAVTEGDTKGMVFRFQAKSTSWGPAGAKVMKTIGAKTAVVLAQQNPFVVAMIEPFKAEFAKLGGKVLDVVMYNPDQPSYRSEVEKAFGGDPDAVFCLSLLTDFVSIAKEVYRGGFKSKIVALSIGADAEGKFLQAVGPEVANGIYHLQPAPPLDAPSYKRFVKEMGAAPGTVFLFAGNAHDQMCVTALAMEHAKSSDAKVWAKSVFEVCNPPGEEVDDVVKGLELIRAGKKIKFVGAGATCDFDARGDQINRSFLVQEIKGGKNVSLGIIT